KNIPETAAAEQDQQRGPERPSRDRIAHEHQDACRKIEFGSVLHGFPHTERHADQIAEKKPREADRQRNGEAGLDDVPDGLLIDVGLTEIEMQDFPEPGDIARVNGFVEAVIPGDLVNRFLRNLDSAAHGGAAALAATGGGHLETQDLPLDGTT